MLLDRNRRAAYPLKRIPDFWSSVLGHRIGIEHVLPTTLEQLGDQRRPEPSLLIEFARRVERGTCADYYEERLLDHRVSIGLGQGCGPSLGRAPNRSTRSRERRNYDRRWRPT